MANEKNKVLAGWYEDCCIRCSLNKQWAYIERSSDEYVFFNKLNVLKIEDVSSIHTDASALNTTIATEAFGLGAGMAMSHGKGSKIKKVTWKHGGTSLIEIDADVEKAIIVGMYQDITEEEEKSINVDEKKRNDFDERANGLYWLLVFGYILFYIFASL